MPARMRIRVDLPAPFSPTSPTTSCGRSSRLTDFSAWTPGKRLSTFCRAEGRGGHLTILVRARSIESADRDDDHQALHRLLDVRADAHQHHAVGQHHHDQHADQGLQHAALTARQRGAADHHGGDRREQAALADQRIAEAELGRGQHAAQRVEHAGNGEGRDPDPVDRDAGQGGQILAAAQRVHVAAAVACDPGSRRRRPVPPAPARRRTAGPGCARWRGRGSARR